MISMVVGLSGWAPLCCVGKQGVKVHIIDMPRPGMARIICGRAMYRQTLVDQPSPGRAGWSIRAGLRASGGRRLQALNRDYRLNGHRISATAQ